MAHTKANALAEQLLEQRNEAEERDAKRRAAKFNLPYLNLISVKVPTEIKAMALVPESDAKKALLVPLQLVKSSLVIAVFDPTKKEAKALVEKLKKNYEVEVVITSKRNLEHAWGYYKYVIGEAKEISGKVELNDESVKKFETTIKKIEDLTYAIQNFKSPYVSHVLEIILAGALALKVSDIHLEPGEEKSTLRFRIDGFLHTAYTEFQHFVYQSLITRIKLLSNLKLNIHDEPQDGRFTINLKDRDIEIRTSVIPAEYGETIVLRLLDPLTLKLGLEQLGLRPDDLVIIKEVIKKPTGLILNTGPTGSGKTTTLYAFLRSIARSEIKIITIEDPIEYHLPGVSQTQVDLDSGYTFANGLRSMLRQDPDVVLVGEIRDRETAEIALNAALTGHLVLSTLHTNDAVGAIPRLIDLGAKTQILGPALSLIIAQRLVRRLCPYCKVEQKISASTRKKIQDFIEKLPSRVDKTALKNFKIYEPNGCLKCGHIGYKDRISIFELFVVAEKTEEAIYKNPTEIELKNLAKEQAMVTMQEDGVIKVLQGTTGLEEIERLTGHLSWLK